MDVKMTKNANICDPGRGDTIIRDDASDEKMREIGNTSDTACGDKKLRGPIDLIPLISAMTPHVGSPLTS